MMLGLGPKEGPAFLQWAEKNGQMPSLEKAKEIVAAPIDAHNVKALYKRSEALYDLGQDKKAGEAMAAAISEARKQNIGYDVPDETTNYDFVAKGIVPNRSRLIESHEFQKGLEEKGLLVNWPLKKHIVLQVDHPASHPPAY